MKKPRRTREEYIAMLNDPERVEWQRPDEVIAAMHIQPTEVIADVGSGTGYFARRFAPFAAKVYAVDVDAGFLEIAAHDHPANLDTLLAAPDDPRLPPASVDTIFLCNVVHHLEDRPAYYRRLRESLRPGGRIVLLEWRYEPLPIGPPPERKLPLPELTREWREAGFSLAEEQDFLPYQCFLILKPRPTA